MSLKVQFISDSDRMLTIVHRTVDILMKVMTNAKERDFGEWQQLFKDASPGFKFLGVSHPPGTRNAIVEAEWVGV